MYYYSEKLSPSHTHSLHAYLTHSLNFSLTPSLPSSPSFLHFTYFPSLPTPSLFLSPFLTPFLPLPPFPLSLPTCHNCVILYGPSHDHDGVVKRSLRLFDELLRPSTKDQSTSLGLGTACEDVVPIKVKGHIVMALRSTAGDTMQYSVP